MLRLSRSGLSVRFCGVIFHFGSCVQDSPCGAEFCFPLQPPLTCNGSAVMTRPAFKTSSVFHSPPDHLLNRDGKSAFMLSSYLVTPCVSSFLCVGSVTLLVSLVYSAIPLLLNTSLPASSLLSLLSASPWHSGYSIRLFLPAFLLAASPRNAGKEREGLISWFFMLSDTHSTSEFIALHFSCKHSSPTL